MFRLTRQSGRVCVKGRRYYPGKKVGQAFQPDFKPRQAGKPDFKPRQAGKPDLLSCRGNSGLRRPLLFRTVFCIEDIMGSGIMVVGKSSLVQESPLFGELCGTP